MRIGIVESVETTQGRALLAVRADDTRIKEVILLQVAGHRSRVVAGTRVLLATLDGDDTQVFALPWELTPDTADVELRRSSGIRIVLGESDITITCAEGAKVRVGDGSATPAPLAFKSDADSLNDRIAALESALNALITLYNAHTHANAGASPPASPATPASTSATVEGTAITEAA